MNYIITQSRLLYIMSIDDRKHKGLLKVGEVFVDNDVADSNDMQEYDHAVRGILDKRAYMQGVGSYRLEYVECTTYEQNTKCYKADDVYRTLNAMEVPFKSLNKIKHAEVDVWYSCSVEDVREAIKKIKSGNGAGYGEIVFRPEQKDAIKKTVDYFQETFKDKKKGKYFLWNAKMRFGKTLCGLEVANRMDYKSTLIITHRPVVDESWREDFKKIFGTDSRYIYATRMSDNDSEGGDFYHLIESVKNGSKRLVFFVSMQYLRLSQYVGGKEKNLDPLKKAIMEYDWDFVMVDEAHEGIDAVAGIRVMDKLRKEKTPILSLSGTPFNLLDKYEESEIYTWDYVMEQKAKQDWDNLHYGDPNPYADLPRMQILTFTLPKMLREEAIQNNEVFKFHEFFRVWTEDDKAKLQRRIDRETNALKKVQLQAQLEEIQVDKFVYEGAVNSFLKKLVHNSDTSQYPFSTSEFRDKFRHTFWILPGVKEAAALEKLLLAHPVFGEAKGKFKIINAAGDGNIEDKDGSALAEVLDNIRGNKKKNITAKARTITLSCGKLTTGVSVPEWTAVLCMKGSENTPAANYMQTIFRVQTHAVLNGRQKSDCYVFDFAPDRALTAVAETAKMAVYATTERGKGQLKLTQKKEEEHLESFIKLCPVLSMDEGEMGRHITANQIFEKLNNVYIERAVRSGYSDNSLYNPDQLLNLTPEQEKALGDVSDLLGSMPNLWKPEKININSNGLGNAESPDKIKYIFYLSGESGRPSRPSMSAVKDGNNKPTTDDEGWDDVMNLPTSIFRYLFVSHSCLIDGEWTEFSNPELWKEYKETSGEDDKAKRERNKENQEKRARMSVLRGVSIRIPLLVYGAEINDEAGEEITIDNFASEEIVDQASWDEFMPKGFTKEIFNILKDCFDRAIFTGAAKRIRTMVKEADNLNTEDRIDKIATIFSYFHNPDKETVLTPWMVVNKHLSETIGGWCFYNEQFDEINTIENEFHENIKFPREVDKGEVTKNIFKDYNSRILELNSKSGLYPLYMAYSLFKYAKEPEYRNFELTGERGKNNDAIQYDRQVGDDFEIWKDVLQDNIFVVCRTKMAVSITKRTLAGFRKDIRMNVRCYEHEVPVKDLLNSKVLKDNDEGVDKENYTYNGQDSVMCDMIHVLRANPEIFEADIVRGKDYWHVYNSIPTNENEDINNMKFNVVVGNPPYQETVAVKDTENGQKRVKSIFQYFQLSGEKVARYTSLIYPGGRWMHRAGKGMAEFGYNQINDVHLKTLMFFPESSELFNNNDAGIADGLSIVLKDMKKTEHGFKYVYVKGDVEKSMNLDNPGKELIPLNPDDCSILNKMKKVVLEKNFDILHDSVLSQKLFGIESSFVEENIDSVRSYQEGDYIDYSKEIKLYTNDKAGKAGRAMWFVTNRSEITTCQNYIDEWQVVVSSANAGGQKRSNQIAIIDNHSAFGRSRVALKSFKTQKEAENFFKYAQSFLIRFAFLMTDESLTSLAKRVPDIKDYSDDNGYIDFSKDINEQLYEMFDIDPEERRYIERMIAVKDGLSIE